MCQQLCSGLGHFEVVVEAQVEQRCLVEAVEVEEVAWALFRSVLLLYSKPCCHWAPPVTQSPPRWGPSLCSHGARPCRPDSCNSPQCWAVC